tara:strand:- start:3860 stop:4687 length:828 start_codon:yes stop_codon:yes gene_type:complete
MTLDTGALPTGTATDVAVTQFNLVTSAVNNATPWGIVDGGHGTKIKNSGFNALSPATTKGDGLFYTASGVHNRLPAGANNQGIIYDSSEHAGVKVTTMVLPGLQTIPIPVEAITPTTTNGCSLLTLVELPTNKNNFNVLDFDGATKESGSFNIPQLPKSWDKGTVTFRPTFVVSSTSTSGVAWGFELVALAKGDANDVAYGTSSVFITSANGTSYDEIIPTIFSSAVTIAGSPGNNETIEARIFRNPGNAGDTFGSDARLKGITMQFTTNAANDA